METQEQKTPMRDVLLRAIAVLGLIAVLLLGAWGIIQLATSIPALFSNIGGSASTLFTPSAQTETLTVSQSASIGSGQSLEVSWVHANKNGEYSYSISYACQNGLSVKAPLPTGNYQAIACNTPFNFVNASDHMLVIPVISGRASAPLAITVAATKLSSGAVTAQGSATTNVTAAGAATTQPVQTNITSNNAANSASYIPAPVRPVFYGYGDLAVQINSVTPAANGLTAVIFTVQNIGTNRIAAGWNFTANLPINGSYTYVSQPQRALNPGDKVVYTLTYANSNGYGYGNSGYTYTNNGYGYFGQSSYVCNGYVPCVPPSQPSYGNYNYGYSGPVTITVDPQNQVQEMTKANNTAYSSGY